VVLTFLTRLPQRPMDSMMRQVTTPLPAHSLAEIMLSLKVTACAHCGRGPLRARTRRVTWDHHAGHLAIEVVCRSCRSVDTFLFAPVHIDPPDPAVIRRLLATQADAAAAGPINPTDEPSALIDVAGWLTLHSLLIDEARTAAVHARTRADRQRIRHLQILAGQCIDEALKFYEADNDLPPRDAFFTDAGWHRFREHPELYVRDRLLDMRSRLPVHVSEHSASGDGRPRRWWRFWRRR